jgi:hypothetical protein
MLEKIPAALIATVCLLLLVRLCLGERRRWRVDAAAHRYWQAFSHRLVQLWRWPASRRRSRRLAEQAIRDAQGGPAREGNVYRPKAFRQPRKPH